jgi:16S rRNA (cytosine967-C5)-methyltransferase
VLRRQSELDQALDLERADPRLHDVLRLGAYQLRCLTRVPSHAAVSTSVELARETVGDGVTGYVNQALRKLTRETGDQRREPHATHPGWLEERWRQRYGTDEATRLLGWNDSRPSVTLQPARWDSARITSAFRAAGIGVEDAPFGAGLRLAPAAPTSRLPPPASWPGFGEGGWIVQDPAHALVCRFAAIPKGGVVYDACAAPGGKAVALEATGVRVVAGDLKRERLPRMSETIRRAGVAIRGMAADLEAAPIRPGSMDAVLVDAPCTATGTMRRHPDARWRLTPTVFPRVAARQMRLLAAAATLVRPGGLLIYATCSLEPEENAGIVEDFLSRHSDFARAPVRDAVAADLLTDAGDFQSLPQRHGIDGAYAARLVRRA